MLEKERNKNTMYSYHIYLFSDMKVTESKENAEDSFLNKSCPSPGTSIVFKTLSHQLLFIFTTMGSRSFVRQNTMFW